MEWLSCRRFGVVCLVLCLVVGLSCGKECNNVPTERVSHTIRARESAGGGMLGEVSESGNGGVLAMPKAALISSFRKFLSGWSVERWENLARRGGFAEEELKDDDVMVEFDDWGQAWSRIAKPMVKRSVQRGENRRMRGGWSGVPALHPQAADGVDGKYGRRRSLKGAANRTSMLKDVSLHKVRLGAASPQLVAQNTNLQYLLELDIDSMVWSFRKVANLDAPGKPYGGWESPVSELRGHFVGHYLSASALMWASTHNETLQKKMDALIQALKECQSSLGTGYLSAFPSEFFDRFEAIDYVWAPYYTIHKIMAGLLDQYLLAESKDALDMVVEMANYFHKRVKNVIEKFTIERHWKSLNEETGGMNDVLYRLYTVTNENDHLELAHLFDKPCFLGPLALQADHLSGFHSNTHIPVVVGAQMRYEVTGDPIYRSIAEYFMRIITSSHSYATGGTSVSEFWSDPMRQGDTLHTENQETCTTYNMLKIARTLFRWTKKIKYMDYYERALVNGILGTQRGQQPGVMIYMMPMGPGVSKAKSYHGWGNKFDSFWCCYGTAIESFAKLGDSIYFEEDSEIPAVYITQFVSSDYEWDAAGLVLHQSHKPLNVEESVLEVSLSFSRGANVGATASANEEDAAIHIRIPEWTPGNGCRAYLNGKEIEAPTPGKFFSMVRSWSPGDQLVLILPMSLRLEKIQDDRSRYSALHAIMYGPFVMTGLSTGEWKLGNLGSLSKWMHPVPAAYRSQLSTFSQDHVIKGQYSGPLVMACDNGTAVMSSVPVDGTNQCGHATFRVADPLDDHLQKDTYGKRLVSLELFSQPGRFLKHNGKDNLISAGPPNCLQHTAVYDRLRNSKLAKNSERSEILGDCPTEDSVFIFLPGLTGESDTVSFEAASQPGCFLSSSSDATSVQGGVFLRCKTSKNDSTFDAMSTFSVQTGVAAYHPLSFIAEGEYRNFLLAPLNSLRDETYTIYFDIQ
ncbi:hypothetical protein KC19_4G066200 [Ceratodon purpureus]|uniref:Uncharacterized protein n=1 Tax=Ceratodon purpureus TaxID=3225 RepID=A0A8T0I7Q4_CERPU|nr:hypothetical protein KC19_4G066200 [Ceratodon purpureus]